MLTDAPTTTVDAETALAAARSLRPLILAFREELEQGRRLPLPLVEAMREAGIFRIAMPRAWGGLELDPIVQFQIFEELSIADASVGWCAGIGSVGGFFTAYMDQDAARALYPDIDLITAGANRPQGRATVVAGGGGGYNVSGRWNFGSGCQHADRMVGGVLLFDGDSPIVSAAGGPEVRLCYLPREACEIVDTWASTGLRGSGSHDYAVHDLFVPAEHLIDLANGPVQRPGALYAYRWLFLNVHPPVALGIARAAIMALQELAASKVTMFRTGLRDEVYVQTAIARAEAAVASARSYYLDVLGGIWATVNAGDEPSPEQRAAFRLAIVHSHTASLEAVELIYQAAGGSSVYAQSPLDHYLRDLHTINQHVVVGPRTYQTAGRVLLGLDAGVPGF